MPSRPSAPCETSDASAAASPPANGVSRRSFIQTLGLSAAGAAIGTHAEQALAKQDAERAAAGQATTTLGPEPFEITLRVNGQDLKTAIDPATTLMEALRWQLNLTGTKEVCDRGSCGGCSVLIDGAVINSCMMLAVDAIGSEVTTVEGLAKDGQLDPVQEAFCKHDALQCGYCTPGLIMASKALLNDTRRPSIEQIKRGLSGNICRCGTYTNVFNAVLEASGQEPIVDSAAPAGGRT